MTPAPMLLVLADDLIWASRLAAAAERAGLQVRRASTLPADRGEATAAIVDLGGRRFDPVAAVGALARAGVSVGAVCNHEDVALRRRALDAGAAQVWSYNRFHREGARLIERWLGSAVSP